MTQIKSQDFQNWRLPNHHKYKLYNPVNNTVNCSLTHVQLLFNGVHFPLLC